MTPFMGYSKTSRPAGDRLEWCERSRIGSQPLSTPTCCTTSIESRRSNMMRPAKHVHILFGAILNIVLIGCNADSTERDGIVVTANARPTVSISAAPAFGIAPLTVAFEASSATDPDGTVASFHWDFGDGSPNATGSVANHVFQDHGTFIVRLTATDDGGATGSATQTIRVDPGPDSTIDLTGRVTFDRVPFRIDRSGLDYARILPVPARGVVVELVRPDQTVLATTTTGNDGRYHFDAPVNTTVMVRARAELLNEGGTPNDSKWHVAVRNNTNSNALYVLDGALLDTGIANQSRDLRARSGWRASSGSYSEARASAPFAILDSIRRGLDRVAGSSVDGTDFGSLDVYWSRDNRNIQGDADFSDGEIGNTLFIPPSSASSSPSGIYLLGQEGTDTDEFDEYVILHEFFHFLEFSQFGTDSIGGTHSIGDRLDLRVAYSEGTASAFAAIVLGDSRIVDAMGPRQGMAFGFDLEQNVWTNPGWFNEGSVGSIVWDLVDGLAEPSDNISLPFSTILSVLRAELRTTRALTSIFVLIDGLKRRAGVDTEGIDAIVEERDIVASTLDEYASTETNDGGIPESLPIYTEARLNQPAVQVCSTARDGAHYNAIGNRRFVRFSIPTERDVEIRVTGLAQGPTASPLPNPDFLLYRSGFLARSNCAGPATGECDQPLSSEVYRNRLLAGEYVLDVHDRSHVDSTHGIRPSACMLVSIED